MDEGDEMTDEMHARAEMMHMPSILGGMKNKEDNFFLKNEGMTQEKSSRAADEVIESLDKGQGKSLEKKDVDAYRQGQLETFKKVMEKVDGIVSKRVNEGFQEINFTIGVLNCIFVTFVFAAFPQHFWLVYLIESAYLMPSKIMRSIKAKPMSQIFYLFDFCWAMNFLGIVAFTLIATKTLSMDHAFRREIFLSCVGIACGPLLGASAALPFVAVLFHDKNTMTGLFIHIFPPMLAYTLRWYADAIKEAWPNRFDLDYLDEVVFIPEGRWFLLPGQGIGTVAGNALMLYWLWLIPFVSWMLLIGMKLPRKREGDPEPKYDTVFHSWMRGGICISMGSALWKRPREESIRQMKQNDFETRDFLVYMCAHVTMSSIAIFITGSLCFTYQKAHTIFLAFVTAIVAHRGAGRYTYYTTVMYGKELRKEFAALIEEAQNKTQK
mmetsp:Transcript_13237/g.19273  ORF Transcript_13237/g.19273 Transcript_13237/m.19273 type:complete len:438 (+) Transcript_13237:57-1370(+)